MTSSPRLITRTDVLKQLLAAIATVPVGVKLGIPQLRDALVNQADVIAGIEALIAAGELDSQTLRPAVPPEQDQPGQPTRSGGALRRGQSADGEPAQPLFDALKAEGRRRGLSVQATSVAVFGGKSRIYYLTRPGATSRKKTADRIRAWIAAAPEVTIADAAVESPPSLLDRSRSDDVEAGIINREIREFLRQSAMSPTRFGREAIGDAGFVRHLPGRSAVRRKTAERIRAFIASHRVAAAFVAPSSVRVAPRAADPRPVDARRSAAHRKAATTEAAKLLDANPDAMIGRNAQVTTALNGLKDQRAAELRQTDPVEQAKLALQRKGRVVHRADITGGAANRFIVSGQRDPITGRARELTPAALIDLAEQVTGQSFRRSLHDG